MTPVVIAVPHAGRIYPPALLAASVLPRARLEGLEDRFVDELTSDAAEDGATLFIARNARAWIDLNRHECEIDPAMIASSPGPHQLRNSARVRGGLGLVPRRVGRQEIYSGPIDMAEIAARIRQDHTPWHQAIEAALSRAHARFGVALLIDCHSMPPLARAGEPGPQIIFGDRFGRSAAGRLVECAEAMAAGCGFRQARNSPYAGGYALDRHGRPLRNIHAIQVEIDRSLYLAPDLSTPGPGVARMRRFLATLAAALADEALGRTPLAAE